MLSVEPWLVERIAIDYAANVVKGFSALSRAVVGGTAIGGDGDHHFNGFSALSRAVVGGTLLTVCLTLGVESFSALSRAVVGGTGLRRFGAKAIIEFQCSQSSRGWWNSPPQQRTMRHHQFQCSQSSRSWWNQGALQTLQPHQDVSVLSVEP